MNSLLDQLKQRRIELGLKQHDMMLRAGVSRQQYQRLESKGNPRLNTLELIAKGLRSEILLIPQEKMIAVQAILDSNDPDILNKLQKPLQTTEEAHLSDDPWHGLLADGE